MDFEFIEKQWLAHIPSFPFYMSVGEDVEQFIVETEDDFLAHAYSNIGKDAYVAVHGETERMDEIYSRIFLDIDNDNLMIAYQDFIIICNYLNGTYVEHRCYFSGSKGFHIYIDFKPVKIENLKGKLEVFIDFLIETLKVTSIDRSVCVDVKRIARLPYSIHSKTNIMCQPIEVDFKPVFSTIKDLKKYFAGLYIQKEIPIVKSRKNTYFANLIKNVFVPIKPKTKPVGEVDQMFELNLILDNAKLLIHGVRHNAVRLKIIPAMVKFGYDDKTIQATCEGFFKTTFGDCDAKKARWIIAQIRLTRRKGSHPITFANLADNYGVGGSIGI